MFTITHYLLLFIGIPSICETRNIVAVGAADIVRITENNLISIEFYLPIE